MLYTGKREGALTTILAGEDRLPKARELFDHSAAFEWGYLGSGPAQLALALLYHHTGNRTLALTYHQQFKQQVVSRFPVEGWSISGEEIQDWINENVPART